MYIIHMKKNANDLIDRIIISHRLRSKLFLNNILND